MGNEVDDDWDEYWDFEEGQFRELDGRKAISAVAHLLERVPGSLKHRDSWLCQLFPSKKMKLIYEGDLGRQIDPLEVLAWAGK